MTDPYGQPSQPGAYQPTYPGNPYAPSAGQAGDPGRRPLTMTTAMWGMFLGAALSVVSALLTLTHLDAVREAARSQAEKTATGPGVDPDTFINATVAIAIGSAVVGALIYLGLWIWMAIANGRGISWARIVATCFGALGVGISIVGTAGGAFTGSAKVPGSLAISLVDLLLDITLIVLIWLPASSAYYAARTAAKRQARGY